MRAGPLARSLPRLTCPPVPASRPPPLTGSPAQVSALPGPARSWYPGRLYDDPREGDPGDDAADFPLPYRPPGVGFLSTLACHGDWAPRRVGPGRGAGLATSPFPRPARRTRRAPLSATGSPRVVPPVQPRVAVAGSGVHGVGILLPRQR